MAESVLETYYLHFGGLRGGVASTLDAVRFDGSFPQPLVARFDQPDSSSDAGAALVRAADEWLGLTRSLAGVLTDRRQGSKVQHSLPDVLRPRVRRANAGTATPSSARFVNPCRGVVLGGFGRLVVEGCVVSCREEPLAASSLARAALLHACSAHEAAFSPPDRSRATPRRAPPTRGAPAARVGPHRPASASHCDRTATRANPAARPPITTGIGWANSSSRGPPRRCGHLPTRRRPPPPRGHTPPAPATHHEPAKPQPGNQEPAPRPILV